MPLTPDPDPDPNPRMAATAVGIIALGVTVDSVFGPKANGDVSPRDLEAVFAGSPLVLFLCIVGGPLFLGFAAAMHTETTSLGCKQWARSPAGALTLAMGAALFGALMQVQFKAFASAVLSVLGALYAATPIALPYDSPAEGVRHIFCLLSTGLGQIGFLNISISVAPVTYSVPAYQASLLLCTLVMAGTVLGEYGSLPTSHAGAPRAASRCRPRGPTRGT